MAAGLATRMGKDKLALPWRETTVLGYVLQTVLEAFEALKPQDKSFGDLSSYSRLTDIRVVARYPIETYLSVKDINRFRACGGFWLKVPSPKPLAKTICLGLQDLNNEVQVIGFLPGDQVGITAQGLEACLRQVIHNVPDFLVPIAGDKTGSPVFFHRRYVQELLSLREEQGGREVLNRYPERWRMFPVIESSFQDVDTPEEYQALLKTLNGSDGYC